ncbi:hypothetical protein C8K44_104197 [Aminobacter sp. AP02]|nr:hypothetical protein C8K44_104197 [Aminobacter sp. AP02]
MFKTLLWQRPSLVGRAADVRVGRTSGEIVAFGRSAHQSACKRSKLRSLPN